MKMERLYKPISYWHDEKNSNIAYVLYQSFTTRDKSLLGKIHLREKSLRVFDGSNEEDWSFISSFMTDAYSPKAVMSFSHMGNGGNDNQIKKHIHDIIVNMSKVEQGYNIKQLLLHVESDSFQYTYTDVKLLSISEIVKLIEMNILMSFKPGDLKNPFIVA